MTDYPVGPTQLNQSKRVVIRAKAMRFEASFRADEPDANANRKAGAYNRLQPVCRNDAENLELFDTKNTSMSG
jgi:hypothetical protein